MEINRFFFIRHSKTLSNIDGRIMGQLDEPLMVPIIELDISKCDIYLKKDLKVNILCSPAIRCRETIANLVHSLIVQLPLGYINMSFSIDQRLLERNFGDFQGCYKAVLYEKFANQLINGKLNPLFTPPGGEPFKEFYLRVSGFLYDLQVQSQEYQNINTLYFICTHLNVLRVAKCILKDLNPAEVWHTLEFENGVILSQDML